MKSNISLMWLMIMVIAFIGAAAAQATDIDNPTALTSNVIEGEGDGKAETFYYSFTAMKGDVTVTVDAKSDNYSVILDVTLLDDNGGQLLRIQNVANDVGKREVAAKHFVRDQKVIVRVALPKDHHLKLLNYKIKLDGSVKVETPVVEAAPAPTTDPGTAETVPDPAQTTVAPATEPAAADPAAAPTGSDVVQPQAPAGIETKKSSTKQKITEKIKKEVKEVVRKNTPDH